MDNAPVLRCCNFVQDQTKSFLFEVSLLQGAFDAADPRPGAMSGRDDIYVGDLQL